MQRVCHKNARIVAHATWDSRGRTKSGTLWLSCRQHGTTRECGRRARSRENAQVTSEQQIDDSCLLERPSAPTCATMWGLGRLVETGDAHIRRAADEAAPSVHGAEPAQHAFLERLRAFRSLFEVTLVCRRWLLTPTQPVTENRNVEAERHLLGVRLTSDVVLKLSKYNWGMGGS